MGMIVKSRGRKLTLQEAAINAATKRKNRRVPVTLADAMRGLPRRPCEPRDQQRGCGDGAVTEGGGAATAAKVP